MRTSSYGSTTFLLETESDHVLIQNGASEASVPLSDLLEFLATDVPSYSLIAREVAARSIPRFLEITKQRAKAPSAFRALISAPPCDWTSLLAGDPLSQTETFVRYCLDQARCSQHDAGSCKRSAELALFASASLPGSCRADSLKAIAHAYIGNSQRIQSDFDGAVLSFAHAGACLASSQDFDAEAEVDVLHGTLLLSLRRFDEALERLTRAEGHFVEVGDRTSLVDCLNMQGQLHVFRGDHSTAQKRLEEASLLLQEDDDPFLHLSVHHSLLVLIARGGRSPRSEYESRVHLYEASDSARVEGRRRWLLGLMGIAESDWAAARANLSAARSIFQNAADIPVAAEIAVDEAWALLQAGDTGAASNLAATSYTVLRSEGLSADALEAFKLFCEAMRSGVVDSGLRQAAIHQLQLSALRPQA